MRRQERLSAHVDAVADKPVAWGVDDCSAWAADWIRRSGFALVMPSYHSEAAARRLIAKAGGLQALWSGLAGQHGFAPTWSPVLGDVGLVVTRHPDGCEGVAGVIFAEGGYAFWRAEHGVLLFRPRGFVAAWSVPEI